MQNTAPIITPRAFQGWNSELSTPITEDKWTFCCSQLTALSPNYKLHLIHFKFIHRFYRTPVQLYEMGIKADEGCWRCGYAPATFIHMAWNCPPLALFWTTVFNTIHEIIGTPVDPEPHIGLLGYVRDKPVETRKLNAMRLLFAKHRVAIHWGRWGFQR